MHNSAQNKVLIISFYFPPDNTISAVRMGKFAKYLPEFGWDPTILTVDHVRNLPKTLPAEIEEVSITRTSYYSLYELFTGTKNINYVPPLLPLTKQRNTELDFGRLALFLTRLAKPMSTLPVIERLIFEPMGWYRRAVDAGLEVIRKKNINIIFSTFGPSVPHLIASKLHENTGIPWVAEFRDPWSFNPYARHTQPFHYFDKCWEKRTLNHCDLLISVSQFWSKELESLHSKEVVDIPNGFDDKDYEIDVPLLSKFTITYTGNIYPGKRDPTPLFQALVELKQDGSICDEDIEVRFFGQNVRETAQPLIDNFKVNGMVAIYDEVSFRESIKSQRESTALLLLSWNDSNDAGTLTGKIYEYFGAKRPILAIAFKSGAIDALLNETGSGIVANEVAEIKSILLSWFSEFKNTGEIITHFNPRDKLLKAYTRKAQARKLADTFVKVTTRQN